MAALSLQYSAWGPVHGAGFWAKDRQSLICFFSHWPTIFYNSESENKTVPNLLVQELFNVKQLIENPVRMFKQ